MKILTLNTWQELGPWQERWEVTLGGVKRLQPEILAFQELFNRSWAGEIQKQIGSPALLFPEAYAGLVVYSHFPVVSWGIETLSQSPFEDYRRYVLWAELEIKEKRLAFFNTHLSWQLEDGATRRKQVGEVLRLMEEKSPRTESILVGDLNAPPDSKEIQWLLREGKFRDTFHEKHPKDPGLSWNNRNPYVSGAEHRMPDRRIDYILTRGTGPLLKNLLSCDLIFTEPTPEGVWASDHFGLLAEFQ